MLKNEEYKTCTACKAALTECKVLSSAAQLVEMKTRGGLIHANMHFFSLINYTEKCFAKHASNKFVSDRTVDDVLTNYEFTFPCHKPGLEILAYAIFYYIRLRMRQFTYQENGKIKKEAIKIRKTAKLKNN